MWAPASGKSTLARALARGLEFESVSLDTIVWDRRWRRVAPAISRKKLGVLLGRLHSGVVEGEYPELADRLLVWADTVLVLHVSRAERMRRLVARTVRDALNRAEVLPGVRQTWSAGLRLLLWAWRSESELAEARRELVVRAEGLGLLIETVDGVSWRQVANDAKCWTTRGRIDCEGAEVCEGRRGE